MVVKIFNVYDCKSESYGTPFFVKSRGEALRGFGEVSNDVKSTIGKYPGDFTLFEVGEFDVVKGIWTIYPSKVNLGVAIEFVKEKLVNSPVVCD